MSSGEIGERFVLKEQLGDGTFATVWRATDATSGRDVALKVLRQSLPAARQAAQRFEQEARVLSALAHPAIARAYDFVLGPTAAAIVLELVEGRTLLEDLVHRAQIQHVYSVAEVLDIVDRIADGLEHAHERGIVHRDLKPSNVMLSLAGLKILDFGVAKVLGAERQEATTQGRMLGTYAYMSPEQINGEAVDARTDVFALGCIAFELFTLRCTWVRDRDGTASVFDTESLAADGPNNYVNFLARICRGDRPRASQYRPLLPAALDEVLIGALAIDPASRPPTARTLVQAIRQAIPATGLHDSTDGVPIPVAAFGLRIPADPTEVAPAGDKTVAMSLSPPESVEHSLTPPPSPRARLTPPVAERAPLSSSRPPIAAPSTSKPPLGEAPTPVTPGISFRLVRAVQPLVPGLAATVLPRPAEPPNPSPEVEPERSAAVAWIVAFVATFALIVAVVLPEVLTAACALTVTILALAELGVLRRRLRHQSGLARTEALAALVRKDPRLFWQAHATSRREHILEGSPVDAPCPGLALRLPIQPLLRGRYRAGVSFRHPGGALVPIEIDLGRSLEAIRQAESVFQSPLAVAFIELLANRAPSPARMSGGVCELSFALSCDRPEEAQEELWFCLVGASLLAQWLRTKIDDAPH